MSYTIGQFRRDMLNTQNYMESVSYSILPVDIETDSSLGVIFTDYAIRFSNRIQYGNSYYIKIGLKRTEYQQIISINLSNQSGLDSSVQNINTIIIPPKDNSINETAILELVFSPNTSYDQIMLTLQRTAYDYTIENERGTSGRLIKIDENEVITAQIYNILKTLGVNSLNKIGVQGPPGLLMCINGQDIRIGPNGIYEIKNGYKITFIGFIIQESDDTADKKDYFILDYQY